MSDVYIKSIETVYNGYRFRSRLEAKWAVFFDALGIKYEYENYGFELGELGRYLPDFYLPESTWFVEVKGDLNDTKGLQKASWLDNDPPEYSMGCTIFRNLEFARDEMETCNDPRYGPIAMPNSAAIHLQMITPEGRHITYAEHNAAIRKARHARFEFGEKG